MTFTNRARSVAQAAAANSLEIRKLTSENQRLQWDLNNANAKVEVTTENLNNANATIRVLEQQTKTPRCAIMLGYVLMFVLGCLFGDTVHASYSGRKTMQIQKPKLKYIVNPQSPKAFPK